MLRSIRSLPLSKPRLTSLQPAFPSNSQTPHQSIPDKHAPPGYLQIPFNDFPADFPAWRKGILKVLSNKMKHAITGGYVTFNLLENKLRPAHSDRAASMTGVEQ
jgi:hypothetical protein